MNELTLDGKTYVSSKRAAEITGYAKDYVGQLCREGHVEARLVGRNWYVLESSIRDHRFGKGETPSVRQESPRTEATSGWDAPRYESEKPSYIAPLSERMSVNELKNDSEIENSAENASKTPLLSDMQSAWQEWFIKKEERKPETIEESIIEEEPVAPEPVYAAQEQIMEGDTEEEAVQIPIYREERPLNLRNEVVAEETIIEEESPVRVSRSSTARNILLQSAFLAVSLVAIVVTVIGTGLATRFISASSYRLSAIDYLAGTSIYNR